MNRTLLLILLIVGTTCFGEDEAPETSWIDSDEMVSCNPVELKSSDTLQVRLGLGHGRELAVYRHEENIWLFLVVGSPPPDMVSLMPPQEFESVSSIKISPTATGYRWDSEGGNEAVFSKPGKYTLYVSENLESEEGGYKCELTVKNH
ncbi:hypothetical protein P0F26_003659 [Vibrio metschnikovii]|jgi:hypothetical protein|nr:hypothetical protein [Vibrio metschnikovii]EKO3767935.1 hypothetical protein [Vibrio metschnikovii]